MHKLGECNQLLVTNSVIRDGAGVSSGNNYDSLALSSSHPLRNRSASSGCSASIPSDAIVGNESGTRPRLTRLLNSASETSDGVAADTLQDDDDIIVHPVGPNDSFAGVALRYGISIAALRRANQLWPSDPIHLRTELFVPRRGVIFSSHKSTRRASTVAPFISTTNSATASSPDLVASSFVAARNMILSVFPARLSLESLSSKASASEDHELDDLRALSTSDPPFAEEGHELSTLTSLHTHYVRAVVPLSQNSRPLTNRQHPDTHSINDFRSRFGSLSRAVSLERLPHIQPFAARPVRTSQLEPEPAMELPVRRSAFNDGHIHTDGARRKQLPFNIPRELRYG